MRVETQRLVLRPFTLDDEDVIAELYGDSDIMTFMPCGRLTDEEIRAHVRQVVSDWDERPQVNYEMAVIDKADSSKIGRARIHMDYENDTAMLGWLLVRSEWGKGYATEITKALLGYCFDVMRVHRVCALCHPDNIGSWKVMEKCGLRREAHYVRKVRYVDEAGTRWEDELEYAMLTEEFRRM